MAPLRSLFLALLVACVAPSAVFAQDIDGGPLSEVRVGISAYDVHPNLFPLDTGKFHLSDISNISYDLLFTSPEIDAFRWIGSPRPELGTTLNLSGKESLFHLGLTWQAQVFDTPLFVEGSLGAAVHTGYDLDAPIGGKNMGCRVNFYERYGIGTNITENVTAMLAYEHSSNADLCEANSGLSNLGIRVGWKF